MESHVRKIHRLYYPTARKALLRTGDIVLFRASSIEGHLIAEETGSPYSHAAMIGFTPRRLMIAETIQHADEFGPSGVRLLPLSITVTRWPGYYDVYRPLSTDYDGDEAFDFMLGALGAHYGWRHISRVWLRRHLGHVIPPIPNSDVPRWPRDCSALDHAAMRFGHGPQVKTFDCDVTPGDLANPEEMEYLGTLLPEDAFVGVKLHKSEGESS